MEEQQARSTVPAMPQRICAEQVQLLGPCQLMSSNGHGSLC